MRFVLATTGSLGDIKPFLALAIGLQQAGHSVRLAGPRNAANLCAQVGVEFFPIDQDQQARLRAAGSAAGDTASTPGAGPQGQAQLEAGNTLRFGLQRVKSKRRIFHDVNRAAWQACQGAEALVYRIGGYLQVDSIAERLGVPCFKAGLVPYTPTRAFPSLYVYRGFSWGSLGNRLSYALGEQAVWQFFRRPINDFRQDELGLKPYPFMGPDRKHFGSRLPVIYGFSPALLPRPDDWPERVHVTGHWALDELGDWQPPAALRAFLQAGPPPVYIGFGSMISRDPQQTYQVVLEALQRCGQRAILASGWGGVLGQVEPNSRLYSLDYAPHEWLFPRMAAVVHHGGIGTTTAGLKAGAPTVIIPFNYDQPFWGAQVARLGVGPAPIPRQQLNAERLAQAIQMCLEDESIRQNAAVMGRQMRCEDGICHTIEIIHHQMQ